MRNKIGLPEPINLDGIGNNYYDCMKYVYENYMINNFFNRFKREKLKGKYIYIDTKYDKNIKGFPERFWHIVTFEDNINYSIEACINSIDPTINLLDRDRCREIKEECDNKLHIPKNIKSLDKRSECIYRLRRVNRINTIIKLANKEDYRIKIWKKTTINKRKSEKVYIRFQENLIDHIVILEDVGDMYFFVTSFPINHRHKKKNYDKDYNKYISMKK